MTSTDGDGRTEVGMVDRGGGDPASGVIGSPVPLARAVSRRRFIAGAGGALVVGAVAACAPVPAPPASRAVGPTDPVVAAREAARRRPGAPVRDVTLTARPATIDLGGLEVPTWAYNDTAPGSLIRATAGDVLRVRVDNALPVDGPDGGASTVHWHGITVRNDMDGVPVLTQDPIPAGGTQLYEFTAPHPGTYWYHPHVGVQFDRALHGPLIIDDPHEPGGYDVEFVVVLDDWIDGTTTSLGAPPTTPDAVLAELHRTGMSMGMGMGMGMGGGPTSAVGGDGGDVDYPHYLINGRAPQAPVTLNARPGQRARIRVINPGADTAFRVALGGHRLTVTHTDGYPVVPTTVDSVLVGQAERYDLLVSLGDGAFPLVAAAEGKTGGARAIVRTSPSSAAPRDGIAPAELGGRLLGYPDLAAADPVAVPARTPDRVHDIVLGGDMSRYTWTLNGRTFEQREPLPVRDGERVQLRFHNTMSMFHPMHLHGHTFTVRHASGPTSAWPGPRKDTVIVLPNQTEVVDFNADNPGQWAAHCHNLYHEASGMMTSVSYQA